MSSIDVAKPLDQLTENGAPVFAIDSAERIVYWNKECEKLLGVPAQKVLGRRCYQAIGGRDCWGNSYCSRNCPVAHQARDLEADPVQCFPLIVKGAGGTPKRLAISTFAVRDPRPELTTVVHVLREDDQPAASRERASTSELAPIATRRWPFPGKTRSSADQLTTREKEILGCLTEGLSTVAIANKLFISPTTARNHIQNVLHKLGVHTKLAAVALTFRHEVSRTASASA